MIWTTVLYLKPTKNKLATAYVLMGSTLATGTYLVANTGNNILKSCMTGLLYLGAVSIGIALAKKKMLSYESTSLD
jgi:hypothetical protein